MSADANNTVREELSFPRPWGSRTAPVETSAEKPPEGSQPTALPMKIEGGFTGVTEELERRSRDWTMMVRLLEQQRLQLETAEQERVRLYETFSTILPRVLSTGRSLSDAVKATKNGDISSNLSAIFSANVSELDALENVSKSLTANLLWTRSSWEQYARSVLGAQKMREGTRD